MFCLKRSNFVDELVVFSTTFRLVETQTETVYVIQLVYCTFKIKLSLHKYFIFSELTKCCIKLGCSIVIQFHKLIQPLNSPYSLIVCSLLSFVCCSYHPYILHSRLDLYCCYFQLGIVLFANVVKTVSRTNVIAVKFLQQSYVC